MPQYLLTFYLFFECISSYIPELCPPIASVVEGSIVAVKPQPTSRFADKWLDCVWHIKTPDGSISFGHNEEDQFRTYIRITDAKLTRGQWH